MGDLLVAWRGEAFTLVVGLITWMAFKYWLRRPWGSLFWAGVVMGLANEIITEPQWQYSLKVYLWGDISPFIIAGWGFVFAWWLTAADALYRAWFHAEPGAGAGGFLKLRAMDILAGLPICLLNEIIGLRILKLWVYSPWLHWDTMIPLLGYPLEGLVAMCGYLLIAPPAVRFLKDFHRT